MLRNAKQILRECYGNANGMLRECKGNAKGRNARNARDARTKMAESAWKQTKQRTIKFKCIDFNIKERDL